MTDPELDRLVPKMLAGDRQALAKLFSLIERHPGEVPAVMRALGARAGRAYCVGITGPPGAGKSTLVDGLIEVARNEDENVGILAVDPTSVHGSGAVLGDRVRMTRHSLDDGVFIRSLATRGARGGLSRAASAGVRLLDAHGVDLVIVESVGVGQTELDVMTLADAVVVVLVPEAGDAIQMLKAGLTEIADIFVVNKADRDGAERLAAAIGTEVKARSRGGWWSPPVVMTQAHKGTGVASLRKAIQDHRHASEETSNLDARRSQRRKQEFDRAVRDALEARLIQMRGQDAKLAEVTAKVEAGEVEPYTAAEEILRKWWRPTSDRAEPGEERSHTDALAKCPA